VTDSSGFSELIRRLLDYRGLDALALTGVEGPGLRAALDGSRPTLDLLVRLAPVIGLRPSDLCVMAEVAVPEELSPLDDRSGTRVASLVNAAWRLSPQSLACLLALARALPQQERTRPVPEPRPYEVRDEGE
jgi:hypothetical protein